MTREEAIKGLTSLLEVRRKYSVMQTMSDEIEALDMAIEALKTEPFEDAISRKDAIQAIHETMYPFVCGSTDREEDEEFTDEREMALSINKDICKQIENMPYRYPARPTGRWIEDTKDSIYVTCSKCMKYCWTKDYVKNRDFNYCPNCGTRMEENDEDSN